MYRRQEAPVINIGFFVGFHVEDRLFAWTVFINVSSSSSWPPEFCSFFFVFASGIFIFKYLVFSSDSCIFNIYYYLVFYLFSILNFPCLFILLMHIVSIHCFIHNFCGYWVEIVDVGSIFKNFHLPFVGLWHSRVSLFRICLEAVPLSCLYFLVS